MLLVQHNRHIGGMLANGLMQWDALYGGPRSPLFNEYAGMIEDYYRTTYGEKSPQYRQARYTQTHYPDEPLRVRRGGAFVQPARLAGEEHHHAALPSSRGHRA